jgi:hypothetical protein
VVDALQSRRRRETALPVLLRLASRQPRADDPQFRGAYEKGSDPISYASVLDELQGAIRT